MACVVLALHSRERLGLYQGLSAIRNCNLGFAEPYKVFGRSAEPEGRFGSVLTESSPEALGIRGHSQAASQLEIPESRTVNRETRPMIPT